MEPPAILTIFTATADDLDAVMAVMDSAFDPRFGEAWTRSQLASLFVMPGARVALVSREGQVAGFYAARLAGEESELMLLAVEPALRRMGLASRLIDDWRDWGKNRGVVDFFLEMRADNPARSLYERHGFEKCGLRPEYYNGTDGVSRDAITMSYSVV